MGKYMRKGKGVGKMAVIEEALGVRTRARALALERHSKQVSTHTHGLAEADKQVQTCASMECSVPSLPVDAENLSMQPVTSYMELRSRRFEKVAARIGEDAPAQAFNELSCQQPKSGSSDDGAIEVQKSPQESLQHEIRGLSRQASLQSSAVDAGGVNRRRVTPTASTSNSVSVSARKPVGILTRHQRQALAQLGCSDTMEVEAHVEPSGRTDLDLHAEGEQFFGESALVAGPSSKDRYRHRGRTRESTPDSYAWSMEAPGSTSRTRRARRSQGRSLSAPPFNRANEAPSSSEIEAFFQGAEQQERRRFIERYNFDPMCERPLRGRYEWTNT